MAPAERLRLFFYKLARACMHVKPLENTGPWPSLMFINRSCNFSRPIGARTHIGTTLGTCGEKGTGKPGRVRCYLFTNSRGHLLVCVCARPVAGSATCYGALHAWPAPLYTLTYGRRPIESRYEAAWAAARPGW